MMNKSKHSFEDNKWHSTVQNIHTLQEINLWSCRSKLACKSDWSRIILHIAGQSSSSSSAINSRVVQVRSSVRLMPQNQPSGRGLLPSPTAWSPDQHLVAMLADVSRYILGRTEGRDLGFGQLVRTHTGKCLKCQFSSDGHSDHNALCASET